MRLALRVLLEPGKRFGGVTPRAFSDSGRAVQGLTKKNIREGRVALIAGYRVGASMLALGSVGMRARPRFPQMDVTSASFYTDVYRWTLRALNL